MMEIFVRKITLNTSRRVQVLDITDKVCKLLSESGINNGTLTILTQHTTSAISINESEEGLQRDMVDFLKNFIPFGDYVHDRNAVDGRPNTRAHFAAMFANSGESIPVAGGKMQIGEWQSIFFIELDGPREERTVVIQVMGER